MAKFVEIDGIKWYPGTVKEMREENFISAHLKISPYKELKKETATGKLKAIYKQLR